ncbi:MAG: hypothetical protein Q7S01_03070 [bacterium]|nr:hypothetical protein [bacterium]
MNTKNILKHLKTRISNVLYAVAFAPLADVASSQKLRALYSSDADLVTYLNTLFKVAISVGAIIAVLRLMYAGYLYMASDMWTSKESARSIFRDVFVGLLLLLSVYIILKQINPNLLNLDAKLSEVTVVLPSDTRRDWATDPALSAAMATAFGDSGRTWERLRTAGISRNKSECTAAAPTNCTSLGGLGEGAVNGLINLKSACTEAARASCTGSACSCDVTVTGGTESWLHSRGTQHRPGNSVVDLAPSAGLNTFLLGSGVAPVSGQQVTKNFARYTYETTGDNGVSTGNHWHVQY